MIGERSLALPNSRGSSKGACQGMRHGAGHGRHIQDLWPPQRQSSEQVVSNRVTDVGANFGPFPG
jgi:hypothetical protein